MAKRKYTEPNITEPTSAPVEEPAIIQPEVTTSVEEEVKSPEPEIIPEPEVIPPTVEAPKPVPAPVKTKAQRCIMTQLPGGKYQVTLDGVKNLGKWGKEKAECICNHYNN